MFPQTNVGTTLKCQCGGTAVRATPAPGALGAFCLGWTLWEGRGQGVWGEQLNCSHETCHRFPSHHIGIPILILVPTHFLFPDTTARAGRTPSNTRSRRPKSLSRRLVHAHDHDTIISLRRLARRLHCRYVIPCVPQPICALFPAEPTLSAPAPVIHELPLAPPTTYPVRAPQKTRRWRNGTVSPALLEVKLYFPFRVNARAGGLTKGAAIFGTCAPRRVTV